MMMQYAPAGIMRSVGFDDIEEKERRKDLCMKIDGINC